MEVDISLSLEELLEATGGKVVSLGKTTFSGISTDSRTISEGKVFFALKGKNFDGHDFVGKALKTGDGAVVEREVEFPGKTIVVVNDTLDALGRLANWWRKKKQGTIIGITGSSGKTTLKYTVHYTLSWFFSTFQSPGNFNNLVGLPISILMMKNENFGVFELGISEPGEMEKLSSILEPDISIVINAGPSHLEGLTTEEKVAEEKLKVLNFTRKFALVGKGLKRGRNYPVPVFEVSKEFMLGDPVEDLRLSFRDVRYRWRGIEVKVDIPGDTGLYSSLFTLSLGCMMGLDPERIAKVLREIKPLPGRGKIENAKDILIIDDTYNSNPLSLKNSLKTLSLYPGRKIAVIGDMLELGEMEERLHREIGALLKKETRVDMLFLFGKRAKLIGEASGTEYFWSNSVDEIVEALKKKIRPGDAVLIKGSRAMHMERIVERIKEG